MPAHIDSFLGVHEAALRLRAARSEVIASNLANADTPNYQARDIDFKAVLSEYQGTAGGAAMQTTHSRHLSASGGVAAPELMYREPSQPAVDGNTVDSQTEKAAFMENALQYQATLRFIDGSIKTLRTAIRGD
ncbi:MAG: flagellar basal body rod protein FlgB [Thiohalomonadaceae bacterium]